MPNKDNINALNENELVLEQLVQNSSQSSRYSPMTRALYGIDPYNETGALPMSKDGFGLVFFTRPELNLSQDNIKYDRRLASLLTTEQNSVNNYIRCMLDPSLQMGFRNIPEGTVQCPLVDPRQAFIPILTNTCESLSGLRDLNPSTFQTAEGKYRESMSFPDGPSIDYTTYDIQASFRNIVGNIVTRMTFVWLHYMSLCFDGTIVSYPEYWLDNEFDFNSRMFKLSLDVNKEYVTQISSSILFPLNSPIGASGNFENTTPFNRSNDSISISWRAHGSETFDNILIQEFNDCVAYRNSAMLDGSRQGRMQLLTMDEISFFKNTCYPRINPDNSKLEWWVDIENYKNLIPRAWDKERDGQQLQHVIDRSNQPLV